LTRYNKRERRELHIALRERPEENLSFLKKLFIYHDPDETWDQHSYISPIRITQETPDQIFLHPRLSTTTVSDYYRDAWKCTLVYPLLPCIETVVDNETKFCPLEALYCYPSANVIEILESIK
jgi:hypothetical protein